MFSLCCGHPAVITSSRKIGSVKGPDQEHKYKEIAPTRNLCTQFSFYLRNFMK